MTAVKKLNDAPKEKEPYVLYVGVIDIKDNSFNWFEVEKFEDLDKAYKKYKSFVIEQLKYSDEELQDIWGIGRLDIELKQGKKLINWVGIYSREVVEDEDGELVEIEQKESQEEPEILKTLTKVETEEENFKDEAAIVDCDKILSIIEDHLKNNLSKQVVVDLYHAPKNIEGGYEYGSIKYAPKISKEIYETIEEIKHTYPQLKIEGVVDNGYKLVITQPIEECKKPCLNDAIDEVLLEYDGNKVVNSMGNKLFIYWNIDPVRNLPQKVFGPYLTKEELNRKLRELGLPLV